MSFLADTHAGCKSLRLPRSGLSLFIERSLQNETFSRYIKKRVGSPELKASNETCRKKEVNLCDWAENVLPPL